MESFVRALFLSQETLESATHRFLSLLGVQVNFSTLSSRLQEHPGYPSLLSVKDVIDSFGLETLALKPDPEQWPEVTIPFMPQIAGQGRFARSFTVVRPVPEGSWEYLEPATRKWIHVDRSEFVQHFMPVALFAEAGEDTGEADYEETRRRDRAKAWGNRAKTLALPISAIVVFLIGYLSLVGFTYFLGGTLLMLYATRDRNVYFPLLSLLSLAALPYVVYSLFYQWKVVKQWCRLCLATQAILVVQAGLVPYEGWWRVSINPVPVRELFVMLFVYLLLCTLAEVLTTISKQAKEGRENKLSFKRLKSNVRIFDSLLDRERSLDRPADSMGLTLGNPEARNTLIKVCNPYCGPCAKAHPDIESLLRQNRDLKVQILFTATGEDSDNRTPPVRHLLAIASRGDEAMTRHALDDGYLSEDKDYDAFAAKYPMNGELEQQDGHIGRMREWCKVNAIRHTPTYFINGRELPDIYKLADLDYFLKS